LPELLEFADAAWTVAKGGQGERIAAIARKRLNALRTGRSRKD